MKVIYLKCYKSFNITLSIYLLFMIESISRKEQVDKEIRNKGRNIKKTETNNIKKTKRVKNKIERKKDEKYIIRRERRR